MKANELEVTKGDKIEYTKHKQSLSVERGRCMICETAFVELFRYPFLPQLGFIPTSLFPIGFDAPEPFGHIYYDTRQVDVKDDLPKWQGSRKSNWGMLPGLAKVVLGR